MNVSTKDPVILTYSGEYVNLVNPEPDTINITDIAHALSNINRYTGHTSHPYSVAEHSIRVAELLKAEGYSPRSQLAGLLHDAAEAYLGDMSTPLKQLLPEYKALEKNFETVIELRFNVIIHSRPEIKAADVNLLKAERDLLLPPNGQWDILHGLEDGYVCKQLCKHFKRSAIQYGARRPQDVEKWFLNCFDRLVAVC